MVTGVQTCALPIFLPKMKGQGIWQELLNTAHPGQTRLVKTPAINLLSFSLFLLRFAEQP